MRTVHSKFISFFFFSKNVYLLAELSMFRIILVRHTGRTTPDPLITVQCCMQRTGVIYNQVNTCKFRRVGRCCTNICPLVGCNNHNPQGHPSQARSGSCIWTCAFPRASTNGSKNTRPAKAALIPTQVILHPEAPAPPPDSPIENAEDPSPRVGANATPASLALTDILPPVSATPVADVGDCQNQQLRNGNRHSPETISNKARYDAKKTDLGYVELRKN